MVTRDKSQTACRRGRRTGQRTRQESHLRVVRGDQEQWGKAGSRKHQVRVGKEPRPPPNTRRMKPIPWGTRTLGPSALAWRAEASSELGGWAASTTHLGSSLHTTSSKPALHRGETKSRGGRDWLRGAGSAQRRELECSARARPSTKFRMQPAPDQRPGKEQ